MSAPEHSPLRQAFTNKSEAAKRRLVRAACIRSLSRRAAHNVRNLRRTLNYDESFEAYFLERFRHHFNTTIEEAQKHFDDYISVVHVYGSLGGATFDPNAVDAWGRPAPGKSLIKAANGIKILQHGDHTSSEFHRARRCIEQAEFICFLGFGFLEENVMRLQLATMPAKHIFASGLGITHGMRQRLKRQLRIHAIKFGGEWDTCKKFLAETDFLGWASIAGAQASEAM
jgi:hypothetical protein